MIMHEMLLIPRVLLHALIVFDTLEHYLTETVKVGHIAHLRVEELRHQGTGSTLVVDLFLPSLVSKLGVSCHGSHRYLCPSPDPVLDH